MKSVFKPLLAIVLSMQIGSAIAQDPPTVRVCSLPLPPHSMLDDQGNSDGFATKVLKRVAERLNWTLEISYMPWLRVVYNSQHGNCDISYTALKRSDYEEYLVFPETPIHERANVLAVRKGSEVTYDGDLTTFMRSYTVGMYLDKAVNDEFETIRNEPWVNIESVTDPELNIRKLLAGRIDAVIENNYTATYELMKLGAQNQVRFLSPALNYTPAYFTFPKSGLLTDRVLEFDKALADYKTTAEYLTLKAYYEGQ